MKQYSGIAKYLDRLPVQIDSGSLAVVVQTAFIHRFKPDIHDMQSDLLPELEELRVTDDRIDSCPADVLLSDPSLLEEFGDPGETFWIEEGLVIDKVDVLLLNPRDLIHHVLGSSLKVFAVHHMMNNTEVAVICTSCRGSYRCDVRVHRLKTVVLVGRSPDREIFGTVHQIAPGPGDVLYRWKMRRFGRGLFRKTGVINGQDGGAVCKRIATP